MNKDDDKDYEKFWGQKPNYKPTLGEKLSDFYKNHKIISVLALSFIVTYPMTSCVDRIQRNSDIRETQVDYILNGKLELKKKLKDQNSLEILELYTAETSEEVFGCLTYTAKNSFNANIQGKALIQARKSDNRFFVKTENEEGFSDLWPMGCQNQSYKYIDRTNYYK